MRSTEIRETFIEFFQERGHRVVSSSSLIPNDPTLLLTNAGMVQFKPYFLGEERSPFSRATSVQKCVRTTDIDSVGHTARHSTFFEMLGNFSFGDYYKEDAISWAWELISSVFVIEPSALWISVFEEDSEAEMIWRQVPGVDPERIIRLGADDNFWDMGATGPCGPCSEILYDRGAQFACGPGCAAGCDCDRFLELWNLVFMQYDRQADKSLAPLPKKNIDTGLGLERVAALKQGVSNIFETDIIAPIIESISSLCGIQPGDSKDGDVSMKVVADHARASTFLIADGVIPSNEGRGYILRRLLRRAVRHGRLLGIERQFMDGLADVVVGLMGDVYPELKEHHKLVSGVIKAEEERFGQTLEQGIDLLGEVIRDHREAGKDLIEGSTVFYLHDTLGFPLEVTEEIVADQDMEVDREGFDELMEEQRERARLSREGEAADEADALSGLCEELEATGFQGYQTCRCQSRILAIIVGGETVDEVDGDYDVELVLDRTPFYAESGGQVGDTGWIRTPGGAVQVEDTHYGPGNIIIHRGRLTGHLKVGTPVEAIVDEERRLRISCNHSATHILHWALRKVLGTHAKQSGSLVTPQRLRFDFTHFQPLDLQELREIERLANLKVMADVPVGVAEKEKEEALAGGAVALFGEKYAERVRVVNIGGFSQELCGGIHVDRSGKIGPIRIVSETGIGAGLRRIEATTGLETLEYYRRLEDLARKTGDLLKVPTDQIPGKLSEMLSRLRDLERTSAMEAAKEVSDLAGEIVDSGRKLQEGGYSVFLGRASGVDQRNLRDLSDIIMNREDFDIVAVAGDVGKKAQLVVKIRKGLLERGFDARELVSRGGEVLGGGGGGRPDMAVAGGGRPEAVDESLLEVERAVFEVIEGKS